MTARALFGVTLGLVVLVCLPGGLEAAFPDMQGFENDIDTWAPDDDINYVWWEDETLDDTSAPPNGFHEIRNTGDDGIIEEVPSGWAGVTASHGDNFGVVYPLFTFSGLHSHPATQQAPLSNAWSYQVDIYTDPAIGSSAPGGTGSQGNGSNGYPDFWWTNALNNPNGNVDGLGGYQTETGMTAEVLDNGVDPKVWRFTTTTGGNPHFDAEVGKWYTMEVEFHDNNIDGNMAATHRIWNQDHSQILYSYTLRDLFQGPFPVGSTGGPRYSWWAYLDQNMKRILIDDSGVDAPIVLQQEAAVGAGTNVSVALAGGSANVGGVEATFADVSSSGTFSSVYTQSVSEEHLATIVGGAATDAINFALATQPAQAWSLHFNGDATGDRLIVVSYDDSSILGDEADVRIRHFVDGVWVTPAGQIVDTVNNTITFSTDSFSPFVLSTVPEPSSCMLAVIGVAALIAVRRRSA